MRSGYRPGRYANLTRFDRPISPVRQDQFDSSAPAEICVERACSQAAQVHPRIGAVLCGRSYDTRRDSERVIPNRLAAHIAGSQGGVAEPWYQSFCFCYFDDEDGRRASEHPIRGF